MSSPVLRVRGLSAGYGARTVLHGVDLDLVPGERVAIVGANGSGRSTLLQAMMGLAPWQHGKVWIGDQDISDCVAEDRARAGLSWVPEHRAIFGTLTVEQNLLLGLPDKPCLLQSGTRWQAVGASALEQQYAVFPALQRRQHVCAGALSGGEQQMLAVARALIGAPRVLLADEPFEGLAAAVVLALTAALREFCERGGAVLLVEQRRHPGLAMLVDRQLSLQAGALVPG